jgi:ABC-type branched-subunit amino acid transport system ATPase component
MDVVADFEPEERAFLVSQKIKPDQVLDARGLTKDQWTRRANAEELLFIYGTPCEAKGHILRTRSGHCIQCDTRKIAFIRRDSEIVSDIEAVCQRFPALAERREQMAGTLSGGEQQMLAIGRALMSRPRLLMLDEPSLGLAPLIARQIFDAIRTLNRQDGLTVLIVEQNANHALKLAHRGYVMVNGLITLSGTGSELLQRPEIRAAYLEGGRRE